MIWLKHKVISKKHSSYGFSLLEVMVALALLALSFTTLILVQGRATNLAINGRNITIATQLARFQLNECKRATKKKINSVGDLKLEGDFTEIGFEKFRWECHAPKFNMKTPSSTQMQKGITGQAPDELKKQMPTDTSMAAPILTMITDSMGDSVRELALIIRWTDNNTEEELRVVTHVIDTSAMARLSSMISQGSNQAEQPKKLEQKP